MSEVNIWPIMPKSEISREKSEIIPRTELDIPRMAELETIFEIFYNGKLKKPWFKKKENLKK